MKNIEKIKINIEFRLIKELVLIHFKLQMFSGCFFARLNETEK